MRRLGCLACALGVFLCAGTPVAAQFDVNAAFERINAPELDVPRMVLAFYYAWYRNAEVPSGSGRWAHWEGVLEEDQKIDSSTHYPKLGPYDSLDPELIAQHCAWAREAGIDGLIVSWWGSDCFEDRVLPPLLEACAASGLKVTIYYERVPQPQTVSATVTDLLAALELHADHPAWLRVEDRPVVFVYGRALNQIGLAGWTSVAAEVNRRYAPGVVLMGDQISRASARIFDGVHTYATAGALKDKDVGQVRAWAKSAYRDWVAIAERMGRISTVTVMPGFDNTRGREQGLKVERFSGRSYRTQWEAALRAEPDWVLITSWNEWHEGSEIEPSVEHGDEYISMTTRFAERFKKRPRRTKAPLEQQGVN